MEKKNLKTPLPESAILKNMMIAVFSVAAIFLLKNLIGKTWTGAIAIGICLVIFIIVIFGMKKFHVNQNAQQLTLCICIALFVFAISLNSGAFYSDDFPLYLAVIGLSGLYLMPKYTVIQVILIDVLLLAAYFIHPEKADPFSQYIMCIAMFSIAAITFFMVIKRGRAYIELANMRAEQAEKLLQKLKYTGEELQHNCNSSAARVSELETANIRLENSISELKSGSADISQGAFEVSETFLNMQQRMLATENQIKQLNEEVKHVETSLTESKQSMSDITNDIRTLHGTIYSTNEVFRTLQTEILQISKVTDQLTSIASSTNMLALNASIEASRAGQMGAGFAVVAAKVQELAEDSNHCSSEVVSVVKGMRERIEETSKQLSDSLNAILSSIESLHDFQTNFDHLTTQFDSLYCNIEEQNKNIREMDSIFENLNCKISEMADSSEANQNSVAAMTEVVHMYRDNIEMVVSDNKVIHDVSSSMLELSRS